MVLLTLDASSSTASVCVTRDDALLYESYLHNGRMHAAVLLPMVEDALRCAGLGIAEVDAFGCVVGPGSFTGVRIGVATVMGLAGDKPCAPVDALEALAARAFIDLRFASALALLCDSVAMAALTASRWSWVR